MWALGCFYVHAAQCSTHASSKCMQARAALCLTQANTMGCVHTMSHPRPMPPDQGAHVCSHASMQSGPAQQAEDRLLRLRNDVGASLGQQQHAHPCLESNLRSSAPERGGVGAPQKCYAQQAQLPARRRGRLREPSPLLRAGTRTLTSVGAERGTPHSAVQGASEHCCKLATLTAASSQDCLMLPCPTGRSPALSMVHMPILFKVSYVLAYPMLTGAGRVVLALVDDLLGL